MIWETPGMVTSRSTAAWNGPSTIAMRAVMAVMVTVRRSMWSRWVAAMKACCSVNVPVNAWTRAGILTLSRPLAKSARTAGSRSPEISAARIARPDTPVIWVATDDSLIPLSSNNFSNRWDSRARSAVKIVLERVSWRSSLIGCGGTNEARTRPWAPSSASHWASETSVLRPGRFFACLALTSITSNGQSCSRYRNGFQ